MRRNRSYCLRRMSTEQRILEATKTCCRRWGVSKVTIDDIAAEAKVSRATLYRMFPGGKDVLFEAMRIGELEDFFTRLDAELVGVDDLAEMLVRTVVFATNELRSDAHLALMMASEPGETIGELTVNGVPRIVRMASLFVVPKVERCCDRRTALEVVDILARLVISYFLAPSDIVDLGDPESARRFVASHVLPAVHPSALVGVDR